MADNWKQQKIISGHFSFLYSHQPQDISIIYKKKKTKTEAGESKRKKNFKIRRKKKNK